MDNFGLAERFFVSSIEELKDIQKCVKTDCSCGGQYHCQFCNLDQFKPTKPCRVLRHLLSHWEQRVLYGEHFILKCHNTKACSKSEPHYHCPDCDSCPTRRLRFQDHLKFNTHQMDNTELPSTGITLMENDMEVSTVIADSHPKDVQLPSDVGCGISQSEARKIISEEQNYCALQPKERFFVKGLEELLKIEKCTEVDCPCKRNYHCRFCDTEAFKPTKACKLLKHLNSTHWSQRVPYNDQFIMKCYNVKTCCKKPHFHCPECGYKPELRSLFIKHLERHRNQSIVEKQSIVDLTDSEDSNDMIDSFSQEDSNDMSDRESLPQESTRFFVQGLEELQKIKKCTKVGCPFKRNYHCRFCDTEAFKPTKACKLLSHLTTTHWNQRVPYKDHFLVKCHNVKSCSKQRPHFHCPECGYKPFSRSLCIKHLERHRKQSILDIANAEISNSIADGASLPLNNKELQTVTIIENNMEMTAVIVNSHSVSPDTEELTAVILESRPVSSENSQMQSDVGCVISESETRKIIYEEKNYVSLLDPKGQPKEIIFEENDYVSLLLQQPKDQPKERLFVRGLEDLQKIEKCTKFGCPCKRNYHCRFCDTEAFKPTKACKLLRHLNSTHWSQRVPYKDYFILKCHNVKRCSMIRTHFHCPECSYRPLKRSLIIEHLERHKTGKFNRIPNLDKKISASEPGSHHELSKPIRRTTFNNDQNGLDIQPSQRFVVQSLDDLKTVEKCAKPGCPCNRLFHCKFCDIDRYKPTKRCHLFKHLLSHWSHRVQYKDVFIVKCHNTKRCSRNVTHYHCPECQATSVEKETFRRHLKRHSTPKTEESADADLDESNFVEEFPIFDSDNSGMDATDMDTPKQQTVPCPLTCYPLRLHPGQELRESLCQFVDSNNLKGAFIMSCVGSVNAATLRMADGITIHTFQGPFEIVSLSGTLSGGGHLHTSLSDQHGSVVGGHVVGNMIVHTTAEVMIGDCGGVAFSREPDSATGYDELVIKPLTTQNSLYR